MPDRNLYPPLVIRFVEQDLAGAARVSEGMRVPDAAGTTVRVDDDTSLPREGILRVGALLRVIGSWQDGYFKAEAIRPWRHGTSHPIGQGAGPL